MAYTVSVKTIVRGVGVNAGSARLEITYASPDREVVEDLPVAGFDDVKIKDWAAVRVAVLEAEDAALASITNGFITPVEIVSVVDPKQEAQSALNQSVEALRRLNDLVALKVIQPDDALLIAQIDEAKLKLAETLKP